MRQTNSPLSSDGMHQRFVSQGLSAFFFSTWRTVSYETPSTYRSSTTLSASNRRVQRRRPTGGGVQARATRWASRSPSSFRRYLRRDGRRPIAASAVTQRSSVLSDIGLSSPHHG